MVNITYNHLVYIHGSYMVSLTVVRNFVVYNYM